MLSYNYILLFDGYCKLCSMAVRFVLRHEAGPKIQFASLQSELGKQLLCFYQIDPEKIDSVVFITKGKAFVKSRALIEITLFLKYPYKVLRMLKYLPYSLMDFGYDVVAKYRFKFFGKKNTCRLVDINHSDRFIS